MAAPFDLRSWLVNISEEVLPLEAILREHKFCTREALAVLDDDACKEMRFALAHRKLLVAAVRAQFPELQPGPGVHNVYGWYMYVLSVICGGKQFL